MKLINQNIDQIKSLCSKLGISELYVFGSILTSKFNINSDIDLVVKIDCEDPIEYAETYFNFKFQLEDLLERKIDLIEIKSIKNKTFKSLVDKYKILIYARKAESVA